MSKTEIWQKSGNKYAVYEVEQEYDPEIKNSKLIKKTYLGMAENKGGPYKKARMSPISTIYEYGFINYLESIRIGNTIGEQLLENLSEEEKPVLLLLTYFLIATSYDISFFQKWAKNQWLSKNLQMEEMDTEHLLDLFLRIGKQVESIKELKNFGVNKKNSIGFIQDSTIKMVPVLPDNKYTFTTNIIYQPKVLSGILIFHPDYRNWHYIPKRPADIKKMEELNNQYLTRLYYLKGDTDDILETIENNRRQKFIVTAPSEKDILEIENLLQVKESIQRMELNERVYLHNTNYNTEKFEALENQIIFFQEIINSVEKHLQPFMKQIPYKEDEYSISCGLFSSLHIILPLYEAVFKKHKKQIESLSNCNHFVTSEYLRLSKEKIVVYEDGETEVIS